MATPVWEPPSISFSTIAFKIFLLLAVMIFVIGLIRTWLPDHKLKKWMSAGGLWGNVVAAVFGAITPFCSCSSIPIFISLLKAGVPLGVTFSFLITSPIINEYLVILMAAEFGIPITVAYVAIGLVIGILSGAVLGRMKLDHLEHDIIQSAHEATRKCVQHHWRSRLQFAWDETASVIRQIWVWILVGVAIGAGIITITSPRNRSILSSMLREYSPCRWPRSSAFPCMAVVQPLFR
jgi:uncharacterized membrane protein YraQ (UPF0718 family)